MQWEQRSNRNLFGWADASRRPQTLTLLRSLPEFKLGNLAPKIMAYNGGCNGALFVRLDPKDHPKKGE